MYSPILRNRQSEMLAIKHLFPDVRPKLMPLIDVAAPAKRADKAAGLKYVEKNIARAAKALGGIASVFVDSSELDSAFRLTGGAHPVVTAATAFQQAGIRPVPVTGLHRDAAHRAAARLVAASISLNEVCVRLDATDVSTATLTHMRLQSLLAAEGFLPSQVYILIDLQCLYDQEPEPTITQVNRFLKLVNADSWAGIVVGGYGIPDQLSTAVSTKGEAYLPRIEQQVFLKAAEQDLDSPIWFADYTTLAPSSVELDWRVIAKVMSPKALYALDDDWFVVRGGAFSSHPDEYAQYYSMAKKIVDLDDCCDEEHCYGDQYIWERSRGLGKPGSPGSWITACVNHHVTLTANNHA